MHNKMLIEVWYGTEKRTYPGKRRVLLTSAAAGQTWQILRTRVGEWCRGRFSPEPPYRGGHWPHSAPWTRPNPTSARRRTSGADSWGLPTRTPNVSFLRLKREFSISFLEELIENVLCTEGKRFTLKTMSFQLQADILFQNNEKYLDKILNCWLTVDSTSSTSSGSNLICPWCVRGFRSLYRCTWWDQSRW